MSDFKVRCIDPRSSGCFRLGDISEFKGGILYKSNGEEYTGRCLEINSVEVLNRRVIPQFELVEDLPRICYILGEDNPLKIGEKFSIQGYAGSPCQILEDGVIYGVAMYPISADVFDLINHPEKIIRTPQFSEDEKALMREYARLGYPIFSRLDNERIRAEKPELKDWFMLPMDMLHGITTSNSPFDAAEFLEGLK